MQDMPQTAVFAQPNVYPTLKNKKKKNTSKEKENLLAVYFHFRL